MPRYCAHYKHPATGIVRLEIRRAGNYWQALSELPMAIVTPIDGKKYRRQGVPKIYDEGDNNQ